MALVLTPEALWTLAGQDAELQQRLKGFDGVIRVSVPPGAADLVVSKGEVSEAREPVGEAMLELVVPSELLTFVSKQVPPPGYQGLTSAQAHGVRLKGAAAQRVQLVGALNRLYELLRQAEGAPPPAELPGGGELFADTDVAVGRYVHLEVEGNSYRVFYEEAGTGAQPLMLQHTAGADARQWRHQLADPEFQRRFRIIAYDLPYHGRSLPPTGRAWWAEAHVPTKEWLMKFVVALADKLSLERPIFMGCSVGGQLALDLAAHHGERFAAFVALNGTLDMVPHTAFNDACSDPRTPTDWYATAMYDATSPHAPEALRREVYWVYARTTVAFFPADLVYFSEEHDLKIDGHLLQPHLHKIYALAGEYDPVALDPYHGAPAVADKYPGVVWNKLEQLSHFAPSDTPLKFREQVLPILDEITGTPGAR